VNYTFRRFRRRNYCAGGPRRHPGFQFAIKANQKSRTSAGCGTWLSLRRFPGALEPLAAEKKLGPVLFQLPPYLKTDSALLKDFLATVRAACSLRSSFVTYRGLARKSTRSCATRTWPFATRKGKLETPEVQTADFAYLRLRKESIPRRTEDDRQDRFRSRQTRHAYVYFKHEETPEGAFERRDAAWRRAGTA